MELYFANWSLPYYHDCSVRNRTFEEWNEQGQVDIITSIPLMIYGIFMTIIYVLSIIVFTTHSDIWVNPFYRIMFWISFCDLSTTIMVADIQSILQMLGAVFCSYPHAIYYISCFGEAGWAGSCIGCFFLIGSRLIDLLNKDWYETCFGGNRIFYSLGICALYWCIFFFMVNPVIFNSRMRTWLYDPMVYEDGRWAQYYTYRIVILNNMGLTSLNLMVYVVFAFHFFKKFQVGQGSKGKGKLMFFMQSTVICANHAIVGCLYVIMNWLPPNPMLSTIASLLYQLSGGSSAITYVAFNKTIRTKMMIVIGMKKEKSNKLFTTTTTTNATKQSMAKVQ